MIEIFIYVLIFTAFLCLYRIGMGPTPADRAVAIDILGILVVGFCVMITILTGKDFYLNVALAWGLFSFIGSIAIAKYMEGKGFDE